MIDNGNNDGKSPSKISLQNKEKNMTIQNLFQVLCDTDQNDPVRTDAAFDNILFSKDPNTNAFLIEQLYVQNNNPTIMIACMQLLAYRSSQNRMNKWQYRCDSSLLLNRAADALIVGLSSSYPTVRIEACMALDDFCENNISSKDWDAFTSQNLPYVFDDSKLVQKIVDSLNEANDDSFEGLSDRIESTVQDISNRFINMQRNSQKKQSTSTN